MQLKFVMTECSKTQIRLTGLNCVFVAPTVIATKPKEENDENGEMKIYKHVVPVSHMHLSQVRRPERSC